jgi:hypothetical protein
MKARFDTGTDAAMLGVWDAERDDRPFTALNIDRQRIALDDDARAGHIFVVRTHADGGGPVDVYVDESVPDAITARLTPLDGEYLLVLPSGSLIIDGAETYRTGTPDEKQKRQVAVALVITPLVFFGYFHVRQWVPQRNARYARLDDVIPAFRHEHQDPTFVFELRRLDDRAGLAGGSVSL